MPVSGLVVSLSDREDLRDAALAEIRKEHRLETGVIESQRMAVVMNTATADEDKQLWNWLNELPGVVFVDVAMVGFESDDAPQHPTAGQPENSSSSTARNE